MTLAADRGRLWTDLRREILAEFRCLFSATVLLSVQHERAIIVADQARYYHWAAKEMRRMPPWLASKIRSLNSSDGVKAHHAERLELRRAQEARQREERQAAQKERRRVAEVEHALKQSARRSKAQRTRRNREARQRRAARCPILVDKPSAAALEIRGVDTSS